MGADKALADAAGIPVAVRAARALASVARPVLAVGREAGTGLPAVDDPREGPLVALVAGAGALAADGHDGPVLVVACDLPLVTARLLAFLAAERARLGAAAVVPVVDGHDQPLCACYGPEALGVARALVSEGRRAMRDLLAAVDVVRLDEEALAHVASPDALLDVDTPEELAEARRILDGPA